MPVAQLVEHLTFNQGVRDSNSRGRTKKHQTIFVRCFFVVSFKILNIVIPFWLLSPLFISSRSSPPSRTGWRRSCRCRWPPWPGTMPRAAPPDGNMPQHLPRSWNTFALGWGMPFADFTHTNNKHRAAMQGGPACGTVLCCIRLLSGYCFFLASCLPTAHSQSNAAAARAGYTIRPNSWYQVGIK